MTGPSGKPVHCIGAVVRTDTLFRFRRTAALITLLLTAASVYLIVPDFHTGKTLMQIEGRRVIYNSAAVALGTGMFCSLMLSLTGYYLISNSFRRDILSRTGLIIAASPVKNAQYVFGKFLGNALYLAAIMLACMLSAMVMFMIRGEADIQPFTFLTIYLWISIPTILFSSAAALLFESFPRLSGRFGDVLYFFLWAGMFATPVALFENEVRMFWVHGLEIVGLIPVMEQVQRQLHTSSMSIGMTDYDATRPPILYEGLQWSWEIIGLRILTFVLPAILLAIAAKSFHRFNPARIKSSVRHSRRNLISGLNTMLKPVSRFIQPLASIGGSRASIFNAIRADVFVTLALSPVTTLAMVIFAIISLSVDGTSLREGVLPAIVIALVIALADIATRDSAGGMMNLLFTAPKIKRNYVLWKLASAMVVTLSFTLIPIVRLMSGMRPSGISLMIGTCFVASGAVGLGVLARSQKAFIAFFLMLLYISLNAADEPVFDFAGFHARASVSVQLGYAALSGVLILAGLLRHAVRCRRGEK